MNKVILIGRLTKDPTTTYTSGHQPLQVTRISIAVDRRYKKDDNVSADFINIVSFGKTAEFIEKYFKKGQKIGIVGRINVNMTEDNNGTKRWITSVIADEVEFIDKKMDTNNSPKDIVDDGGFAVIKDSVYEEDLPF